MHVGIKTFARATWWGAMVGGGPFLLITVPTILSVISEMATRDLPLALLLVVLPILVSATVTMAALIVIGLPLTVWLHHRQAERVGPYGLTGAACGFLLPLLVMLVNSSVDWTFLFLAIPGALAGTTAATVWGNWREQVALASVEEAETPRPDRGERWLR